jgi:dolichyl-phosphate-mannose-protein mannosyltransferase
MITVVKKDIVASIAFSLFLSIGQSAPAKSRLQTQSLRGWASVRCLQEPSPDVEEKSVTLKQVVALAGLTFVAHMLVAGNYGYFRDELYYLADGRHLQLGYVDQPLLMGWLAALTRVTVGDSLVAIRVIPALACALIIVVTGLMAHELGGGRVAQFVGGVAALFTIDFMATGSIFSMDVLDQLWWALASLILVQLLRRDTPRLWLLVTPERRYLRTPWPWLGGGIACLGLRSSTRCRPCYMD